MKKLQKVNIYFFGAGNIIENHIRAFRAYKNICLFSILSRTAAKANILKKKYNIKYVFNNYSEILIEKNSISVAVIGVSISSTHKVCKKVFKLFDYCLVEKPAGYNFLEAKRIYLLSKKYKVKVYVALNRRFFFSSINLKSLSKNNKDKRIVNILDYENSLLNKKFYPKKIISNWMFANSIHVIDYANFLCRGKLVLIKKNLISSNEKLIQLIYSSGDICIYQAIWERPGPWLVTVSTKKVYYKLEPLEDLSIRDKNSYEYKFIKRDKFDQIYKPGFYRQAGDFLNAINKKPSALITLKKSLELMQLISHLYKKK